MTSTASAQPGVPLRRLGASGLAVPVVSLGLWQNFGDAGALETQRRIIVHAIEAGVVHVDLANNYGPPPGASSSHHRQRCAPVSTRSLMVWSIERSASMTAASRTEPASVTT